MEKVLNKFYHQFKRSYQRSVIKFRKYAIKEEYIPRSDYENEAIRICRNLITQPESELLISPKSNKRFINNQKYNINVIISDSSIDVIKNKYFQNVPISPKSREVVINIFDGHVEMRREKMEAEIRSNVKMSLAAIAEETKKIIKK